MEDTNKRLICRMIAGLVASDEDFTDSERVFVEKVMTSFGIPKDEWDAIFPLVEPDEAASEIGRLNGSARETAINLLVEAAAADGKIVDEERDYLSAVARAMSVHQEVIDYRLRKALN